ncbi:DnaJ domain-containing protein [Crassisporium funariophilum]|nr:DnaJ domain-containing protein [Crassisporium funariophilum]
MPNSSIKNYYDVLGIARAASADDIRRAYRKRALETHPDKLEPGATEAEKQAAEQQFHKVHEAFETLGDAVKRKAYDAQSHGRADPSSISEEARRRMKERREWAERQREESNKRLAEFNAKLEREKRAQEEAMAKMARDAAVVADMLKEMYQLNPEFAARRQAALQRKAEREGAEMRGRQRPIHS